MFRTQAICSLRHVLLMLKTRLASGLEHQVPLLLPCSNLVYLSPLLSKHQPFSEAVFGQPVLCPILSPFSPSGRNRKDYLWFLRTALVDWKKKIRLSSKGVAPNGLYSFLMKSTKTNDINEFLKELIVIY